MLEKIVQWMYLQFDSNFLLKTSRMALVDVNIKNQILKKDATIKSNICWSDSMNKKQMS